MKKIFKVCGLWSVVCGLLFSVDAFAYSPKLDQAVKFMLEGKYYEALDECYAQERTGNNGLKAESLAIQGECFTKLGEYAQARDAYKKGINYTSGDLQTQLYMGIADSYLMEYAFDNAISVYEQLLKNKNSSDHECALYFKLGKAYQKKSEWAQSKFYFDKLKRKYPNSFEASLIDKASVGGNFFTIQVGCFTREANAKNLYQDLKNKGYEVYITSLPTNGQKLYRVRVGEFVSRMAAEFEEEKLRTQEHLPTHIFP
ncbi:MAG: SPOR domain-containing protein [Candidatus Omnitrophota bacterium]